MIDDHALELHAELKDRWEILNAIERYLGDVKEARHAANLHERTVGFDGLDVSVRSSMVSQERRRVLRSQVFLPLITMPRTRT